MSLQEVTNLCHFECNVGEVLAFKVEDDDTLIQGLPEVDQ